MTTLILSLVSLLIAILSYLGAKRAERNTGLRNELSCLPALMSEKRTNPRGGLVGLLIRNRGTGIGIIEKILVTHQPNFVVDAAQTHDWLGELKSKLSESVKSGGDVQEIKDVAPVKNVYTGSAAAGVTINIGEELWLIQGNPNNLSDDEMKTVIAWTKNLEVQVDYSTVYLRKFSSAESYEKYINLIHKSYQPLISKCISKLRLSPRKLG